MTTLLFERDDVQELDAWPPDVRGLGRSSIMWIDIDQPLDGRVEELAQALELTRETREQLEDGATRPYLEDCEGYLHVAALAPSREDPEPSSGRTRS
jgi:Mg2+ and Co2+ transporter CorA